MSLAQDQEVVEALAADGPDYALDEGILPRSAWGDEHFARAEGGDGPREGVAVDAIPIANKIPGGGLLREGVDELAGGPLAVGWSVTARWTSSRRSWRRTTKTKSRRKVRVGTTKKSIPVVSWRCAERKVRQEGEGGRGGRRMYLATVASATS
jgi:hypothetical protein